MKANEFVKKFGWLQAKNVLQGSEEFDEVSIYLPDDNFGNPTILNVANIKRLVESWELVGIHGLEKSKEIVANAPSDDRFYSWTLGNSGVRDKTVNIGKLRKAIADVESCQC